jgi:large subunit ribosomal protein L31e
VAPKTPGAEEAADEEEEIEIVEEKFYDLNLRRIWAAPREKRTPRAVRYVRQYAAQRMKTDNVSLSEETNSLLWSRGISKPPRKIRIRVVKDKEGKVIVFPGEGK